MSSEELILVFQVLVSADMLTFVASVIGSLAWPLALVTLLLVFQKPVRRVIEAVALRIPQMEEVTGPGGTGAKFSGKEMAIQLREVRYDIASESGPDRSDYAEAIIETPSVVSPEAEVFDVNQDGVPEVGSRSSGAESTGEWSESEVSTSASSKPAEALSTFESANRDRFLRLIYDYYSIISPASAVEHAYSLVEDAVSSLVSPHTPVSFPQLPLGDVLVAEYGVPMKVAHALDGLRKIRNDVTSAADAEIDQKAVEEYAEAAYHVANQIRAVATKRQFLRNFARGGSSGAGGGVGS